MTNATRIERESPNTAYVEDRIGHVGHVRYGDEAACGSKRSSDRIYGIDQFSELPNSNKCFGCYVDLASRGLPR